MNSNFATFTQYSEKMLRLQARRSWKSLRRKVEIYIYIGFLAVFYAGLCLLILLGSLLKENKTERKASNGHEDITTIDNDNRLPAMEATSTPLEVDG